MTPNVPTISEVFSISQEGKRTNTLTESDIKAVCRDCKVKITFSEAAQVASPKSRTYSCPSDGTLLVRITRGPAGSKVAPGTMGVRWPRSDGGYDVLSIEGHTGLEVGPIHHVDPEE